MVGVRMAAGGVAYVFAIGGAQGRRGPREGAFSCSVRPCGGPAISGGAPCGMGALLTGVRVCDACGVDVAFGRGGPARITEGEYWEAVDGRLKRSYAC